MRKTHIAVLCTVASVLSGTATAQEMSCPFNLSHEEEIAALHSGDLAATAHAAEHGVAILLHVGMDIQCHEQSEAVLAWVQEEFRSKFAEHGLYVGVFPRMNDGQGTVLTYHVGDHIYSPPGEDPVLSLQQASDFVPDVVEQARIALQLR